MEYRKLSDLKKLEWNPRICKWEKFDKLVKSIKDNWVLEWRPFLLSDRTWELIIIGWNQRYEACKKLGIKEVPTYLIKDLTEEKEREIIIRDNVSNWDWDMDILANEWNAEQLQDWWVDINFETVEPTAEEDDFEVDEGIKTDIVLWDLFEIWDHRLLCGDSTNINDIEKLLKWNKSDMVWTDPPYLMNFVWWIHSDWSKKDDIVLDLFWWSGSTMVACHQLNRKCYMMELDPKYVQTIVNRMIKLDPTIEIKRNWQPYN